MNHRERFVKIFEREKVDRIPCYFFGMWPETKTLWNRQGYDIAIDNDNAGPTLPGMDPDWEKGLWDCHGIANCLPIGDIEYEVIERGETYEKVRDNLGAIIINRTDGASIPHTEKHALLPTRESWNNFKKWWNPDDSTRVANDYLEKISILNNQERVRAFMGGSLYGWLRNYMGVVNISYLMMDNPILYEEMVSHICDVFMCVMGKVLKKAKFEMVYIFEDCCGSNGPLFSPLIGDKILKPYYKKLIRFYKDNGVDLALVDSDGVSDKLIPMWIDSGFDIMFPIEVGTWGGSVEKLRKKYGDSLNAFGGVDKHIIGKSRNDITKHLESLIPQVEKGGYIPIPDHRIPPSISYEQTMIYIEVFHKLFG